MSKKQKLLKQRSITFTSVHSAAYRTVHADGMISQPNVHQNFHLCFYNEAPSLAFKYSREVNEAGNILKDVPDSQVKKSEWTRQMEVEVVVTRELAMSILRVLAQQLKIEILEKQLGLELVSADAKESSDAS